MKKNHFRRLTQMMERFKICWYALTKKHYGFFAYDREVIGHSGAKCYIEDEAEKSRVFIGALKDYASIMWYNLEKHNDTTGSRPTL